MMTKNSWILIGVLMLGACATSSLEKPVPPAGATLCEARSEVCTMDYRPVCGAREDNSVKTYPNGCGACANLEVVFWVEGACPE